MYRHTTIANIRFKKIKQRQIMKKILFLLFALLAFPGMAQEENTSAPMPEIPNTYRYRVYLTDKKESPYSLKRPGEFLSEKALQRRARLELKVDEYDLPVSPTYINGLKEQGMKVLHCSKWNNTAVVETQDTAAANALSALPYVSRVVKVWKSNNRTVSADRPERHSIVTNNLKATPKFYGAGQHQIEMLNGNLLHQQGFKGEGMTIAVIDGGFYNADTLEALSKCKILGTRNFVRPDRGVYDEQSHGMMVLSCIGANAPFSLVGTAPNASFYLLVSEDGDSESLVEEDNWCAAVEYADSLGCDIITSSLGYTEFDDTTTSHQYHEMDGRTAINSRSASLAASRGLLVLNSAGNSGNDQWKLIGFPADAHNILAVGAVNADGRNTLFSSLGNSADGRIKPEVMAMGGKTSLLDIDGSITRANGTSFSCPVLCGAVACLWQAFPDKRPEEIIKAVCQSGNNAQHPDNVYGYGIPDMWRAYNLLKNAK